MPHRTTQTLFALIGCASLGLSAPALAQTGVAAQGQKCGTSAECQGSLVCIAHHCQPPPPDAPAPAAPPEAPAPMPPAPMPPAPLGPIAPAGPIPPALPTPVPDTRRSSRMMVTGIVLGVAGLPWLIGGSIGMTINRQSAFGESVVGPLYVPSVLSVVLGVLQIGAGIPLAIVGSGPPRPAAAGSLVPRITLAPGRAALTWQL